jgi:1-acyl-sn-glycerol-3-phosphate acyltransferase
MMAVKRPVRLVVAASSIRQAGIGHFIRGLDVIGVERVQDMPEKK